MCAILNSALVRFCVQSYSSAGRGFGAPSVVKYFRIPEYEKGNESHLRISELSKRAHGLAKRYYDGKELEAGEKLNVMEEEVDEAVAGLYGVTGEELEVVRKARGVSKKKSEGERYYICILSRKYK